jgi:DNA helicase II / ATP-dependent DNA helicase PcrA
MFAATEAVNTADWLEECNPEQRAAALHRDGHLLVLAGAGTGKTTTLCARVASLVAGGVPPSGSCC